MSPQYPNLNPDHIILSTVETSDSWSIYISLWWRHLMVGLYINCLWWIHLTVGLYR